MTNANKTGLVVTAHPGDFVWRAGGAIALHAKKGYRVKIACLSFGESGESQFAWKEAGATMEKLKAGRRDEAQRAAEMLGAELEFFDAGGVPVRAAPAGDVQFQAAGDPQHRRGVGDQAQDVRDSRRAKASVGLL